MSRQSIVIGVETKKRSIVGLSRVPNSSLTVVDGHSLADRVDWFETTHDQSGQKREKSESQEDASAFFYIGLVLFIYPVEQLKEEIFQTDQFVFNKLHLYNLNLKLYKPPWTAKINDILFLLLNSW